MLKFLNHFNKKCIYTKIQYICLQRVIYTSCSVILLYCWPCDVMCVISPSPTTKIWVSTKCLLEMCTNLIPFSGYKLYIKIPFQIFNQKKWVRFKHTKKCHKQVAVYSQMGHWATKFASRYNSHVWFQTLNHKHDLGTHPPPSSSTWFWARCPPAGCQGEGCQAGWSSGCCCRGCSETRAEWALCSWGSS